MSEGRGLLKLFCGDSHRVENLLFNNSRICADLFVSAVEIERVAATLIGFTLTIDQIVAMMTMMLFWLCRERAWS